MAEMVRVNTRISKQLNDWLDEQSEETGVPKSTIVFLALEMYMQQKQAMQKVDTLANLTKDVELLKSVITKATEVK